MAPQNISSRLLTFNLQAGVFPVNCLALKILQEKMLPKIDNGINFCLSTCTVPAEVYLTSKNVNQPVEFTDEESK